MDRLDTGPVGAAGGDLLKGSDGDRMGFVVEARAVLTGKPDRPLRPTLRQDEVGICIGCDRDRAAATKDRRRCASQRIARRARDPRVVGLASAPRKKTQVGRLACDMAAEAGRRWRRHQRARYRRRGCSTGCERCERCD